MVRKIEPWGFSQHVVFGIYNVFYAGLTTVRTPIFAFHYSSKWTSYGYYPPCHHINIHYSQMESSWSISAKWCDTKLHCVNSRRRHWQELHQGLYQHWVKCWKLAPYHFAVAAVMTSQGPFANEYILQTHEDGKYMIITLLGMRNNIHKGITTLDAFSEVRSPISCKE